MENSSTETKQGESPKEILAAPGYQDFREQFPEIRELVSGIVHEVNPESLELNAQRKSSALLGLDAIDHLNGDPESYIYRSYGKTVLNGFDVLVYSRVAKEAAFVHHEFFAVIFDPERGVPIGEKRISDWDEGALDGKYRAVTVGAFREDGKIQRQGKLSKVKPEELVQEGLDMFEVGEDGDWEERRVNVPGVEFLGRYLAEADENINRSVICLVLQGVSGGDNLDVLIDEGFMYEGLGYRKSRNVSPITSVSKVADEVTELHYIGDDLEGAASYKIKVEDAELVLIRRRLDPQSRTWEETIFWQEVIK